MVEEKNRSGKGPTTTVWSPEQRCFEFLRDTTRPSHIGRSGTSKDLARRTAGFHVAVNKELHRAGADVRIRDLILTRCGKYRGSTSTTSSTEQLLGHRDAVIRVACSADPAVVCHEARTA